MRLKGEIAKVVFIDREERIAPRIALWSPPGVRVGKRNWAGQLVRQEESQAGVVC